METIHASGHKQVRSYNVAGEVMETWVNGEDDTIPYSLDGKGQVTNIDLAKAVHKTSNAYDGAGRQVATTDAAGRTTSREYFPNGWLKRIVRPNGDYIEYTYDKIGRLTEVEELAPMLNIYAPRTTLKVRYGYGTYTADVSYNTGFSVEAGYNRWVEYITEKTDFQPPPCYGTLYFFDENDRLAEVRFLDDDDSTERKYQYTYDGFGNLVEVTKPDANTIEYAYNGLNQMTQEKFDANNFNDFEYDCCMLTKHQQTVGGSQEDPFELAYDKMKRMTQEQYPDSASPKTEYFDYEYDQAGRRVKMVDPTYGRDDSKPMRWKYEEDGKVIKVGRTEDDNYLSSQGENYGVMYDDRGRIWKVFYPGDDNQSVMEVEYQYTSGGQIAKIIARNLTDGAGTDIYCQEFEYDVNGRKTRQVQKEKESDADTSAYYVVSFSYDSRDMLTEEKYVRWNSGTSAWDNMYWARYLYDTAGNMVSRVVDQIVNGSSKDYNDFGFTYSRGYQLTGFTRTIGPETRVFTLTYDANGNMTHISQSATFTDTFYNITEMEFQFDEKNRMTHYRFGGSGSYHQIKYDALGRVRERVDLTPTTTKYYSDDRQLIQQLDNSDNVDFDYFRGPTGLMRQLDVDASNKKRFYIKDTLGTVLALVDPSNLSVKHYNYNAWGEHLDKDDTDFPTDENLMRYIGCRVEAFGNSTSQTDAIYHLDNRHYLPFIGFISREPFTFTKSPNLISSDITHSFPNKGYPSMFSFIPGVFNNPAMPGIYNTTNHIHTNSTLPLILNAYNYSNNNISNISDPTGLYVWFSEPSPQSGVIPKIWAFALSELHDGKRHVCLWECTFILYEIFYHPDNTCPWPPCKDQYYYLGDWGYKDFGNYHGQFIAFIDTWGMGSDPEQPDNICSICANPFALDPYDKILTVLEAICEFQHWASGFIIPQPLLNIFPWDPLHENPGTVEQCSDPEGPGVPFSAGYHGKEYGEGHLHYCWNKHY